MPKQRRRERRARRTRRSARAHVVGEQVEQRRRRARDRLADDEREEHEDQRPVRNEPRTSSRLRLGASDRASCPPPTTTGPGHDAPRRRSRTRGRRRRGARSPRRSRRRGSPRSSEPHGTVREELARSSGASAPCRSLATIFSDAAASSSATSSSNTSTIDDVDQRRRRGRSGRCRCATPCATPVSSRTASGSQRIAAIEREVPEVETPEGAPCRGATVRWATGGGGRRRRTRRPRILRVGASRSWPLTAVGPRRTVPSPLPRHFLLSPARVARPGRKVASVAHRPLVRHGRIRYVRASPPRARWSSPVRRATPATPPACASPISPATCPPIFGLGADPDVGLADWLDAGPEAPTEALDRLLVEVAAGRRAAAPRRRPRRRTAAARRRRAGAALAVALGARLVAGARRLRHGARAGDAGRWSRSPTSSLVVLRGCYLALRRAVHAPRARGTPPASCCSTSRAGRCRRRGDRRGARPAGARPGPGQGSASRERSTPACCRRGCPSRWPGPPPTSSRRLGVARRPARCGGVTRRRARPSVATDDDAVLKQRVHRRLVAAGRRRARRPTPSALRRPSGRAAPRRAAAARRAARSTRCSSSSPTRSPASDRSSRCSPIPTVTEVMVNGPGPRLRRARRAARTGRARPRRRRRSSTSSSASSRRSGCGSIARRRWSTPASPTARACTR